MPIAEGSVTVSVVSHGQRAMLAQLLADIAQAPSPLLRRLLITLNLDEAPPELPVIAGCETRLIRNASPRGFGANHNLAFRQCETEWFAILNPDLRWTGDPWQPLLADVTAADGLVAPRVLEMDGTLADSRRALMTPWQIARRRLFPRRQAAAEGADWMAGMFLLVRRRAFEAVGGFDPRFHMYCEDADLCLRLQLAGWRIRLVEDVAVVHAAQRASRRSWQHLRWHSTSLLRHWFSSAFWRFVLARRGAGGNAPMPDPSAASSPDQKAP